MRRKEKTKFSAKKKVLKTNFNIKGQAQDILLTLVFIIFWKNMKKQYQEKNINYCLININTFATHCLYLLYKKFWNCVLKSAAAQNFPSTLNKFPWQPFFSQVLVISEIYGILFLSFSDSGFWYLHHKKCFFLCWKFSLTTFIFQKVCSCRKFLLNINKNKNPPPPQQKNSIIFVCLRKQQKKIKYHSRIGFHLAPTP